MLIGVDFDNTLVCYDELFYREAVARELVPAELPASKEQIRDYCRRAGRNDDWTLLQGHVYGVAIAEARAFPGALEFFSACRDAGVETRIISHRTRYPALGPKHDLHAAALRWLEINDLLDAGRLDGGSRLAYFEETRRAKLDRIAESRCACFIDDLPELLSSPDFPRGVRRVLFDPHGTCPHDADFERVCTWDEATRLLNLRSVVK
jgi:hypothetical protein